MSVLAFRRSDEPWDDGTPHVPDFTALASEQLDDVSKILSADPATYPRLALPALDALAGRMAPEELWVVGARQSAGKSLFAHNVVRWLIAQGVPSLVIGTEQSAGGLRVKQACCDLGIAPKLVLKPNDEQRATGEWESACDLVYARAREYETGVTLRSLVVWAKEEFIDRPVLSAWTDAAVERIGARVVLIDHLHHMQHGAGRNPVEELTATVHLAKALAKRHRITMLAFSQMRRAASGKGNELASFKPPAAEDFAGASAIERTADVALGLWRPLRTDLDPDTLAEMRRNAEMGNENAEQVYMPGTMGVRVLKDRLGDAPGRQAMIAVERGRLEQIPERDRYATSHEGIRTNTPRGL